MWVLEKFKHLLTDSAKSSAGITVEKQRESHAVNDSVFGTDSQISQETGLVTSISLALGSGTIDRHYEFDLSSATTDIQIHMPVQFNAFYDSGRASWIAIDVCPLQEPKDQDTSAAVCHEFSVVRVTPTNVLVKKLITSCITAKMFTLARYQFPNWETILQGDVYVVKYVDKKSNPQRPLILSIDYMDPTEEHGFVTKVQGVYSINNDVYVCPSQLPAHTAVGDFVKFLSVVSQIHAAKQMGRKEDNDRCSFSRRAVNVVQADQPLTAGLGTRMEARRMLFKDKRGLYVEPETIDIHGVINKEVTVVVRVINRSELEAKLQTVYFGQVQDVCTLTVLPSGSKTEIIPPGSGLNLMIACKGAIPGEAKDLLVLDFGEFTIARHVKTMITDPKHCSSVTKGNHQETSVCKRRRALLKMTTDDLDVMPGPSLYGTPFFIENPIKGMKIPAEVRDCFLLDDDFSIKRSYPEACAPLNPSNYTESFRLCLWFEELENELLQKMYDLEDAVLKKRGEEKLLFTIDVPTLREFHQIPLPGDKLIVTASCIKPTRALIRKVHGGSCPPVLELEFLHELPNYTEDLRFSVTFEISKSRFKRMHHALSIAQCHLGNEFLFPSIYRARPSKYIFFENPKNNLRNPIKQQVLANVTANTDITTEAREYSRGKNIPLINTTISSLGSDAEQFELKWFNHNLNKEQRDSVKRILQGQGRPLPYIIYGPPGTGKTVTLVEAILQVYCLDTNSRILITAPSNSAADLVAEKLVTTNLFMPEDLVRLNGFVRATNTDFKQEIKPFCLDASDLGYVVKHFRIVISTLCTAAQLFQVNSDTGHYSHVFIDEAGYATEAESLIPCVLSAQKFDAQIVLAGDPNQLGPVIFCKKDSVAKFLERSLLERLMATKVYARKDNGSYDERVITKLVKNYRSHPLLLEIPSKLFYDHELEPAAGPEIVSFCGQCFHLPKQGIPLVFHGAMGTCKRDTGEYSYYNLEEISVVWQQIQSLVQHNINGKDLGIITPYRKQADKIAEYLKGEMDDLPTIGTVEEFQGQERKVIIISTVRTGVGKFARHKKLEFLDSGKRFNVAITRAKSLLIIVGHPDLLRANYHWKHVVDFCVQLGSTSGCVIDKSDFENKIDEITHNLYP